MRSWALARTGSRVRSDENERDLGTGRDADLGTDGAVLRHEIEHPANLRLRVGINRSGPDRPGGQRQKRLARERNLVGDAR